ncbi:GAF domain-containing protein [Zhouia sp. PK063]|uniref:GAF domain-containing protein n=1 Tax=Zhouia sp. PK063 TaxID=3373602 RepID=UPI0037A50D60
MHNEKERLKELSSFRIMDTSPEKELQDLAEITALLLDMPISLITFIDKERQWFKASNSVLPFTETDRALAFCQHTFAHPDKVLVVDHPECDERFKDNALVTGETNIRFYAGAPLVSNGHVLGTLCVIDQQTRQLSENQQKALQMLADKVMEYLNTRKNLWHQKHEITKSAEKLIKLTENIPSTIFQLRRSQDGAYTYDFISLGSFQLPDTITPDALKAKPELGFELIHPNDQMKFLKSLYRSGIELTPWSIAYQVIAETPIWYMVKAIPEQLDNGDIVWYGVYHDITNYIMHKETLSQIAFDISHILRKPVANLMGIFNVLQEEKQITKEKLNTYLNYIKVISDELHQYTRELNDVYHQKGTAIKPYMKDGTPRGKKALPQL